MRGAQDYAGRLVRLECFLPAWGTEAHRSPGFRPGKPNFGTGVERSLPRDLEKSGNSAQTNLAFCVSEHYETELSSPGHGFSPAIRTELFQNGGDMKLGSMKGDS